MSSIPTTAANIQQQQIHTRTGQKRNNAFYNGGKYTYRHVDKETALSTTVANIHRESTKNKTLNSYP